jgi:hypothetical protein
VKHDISYYSHSEADRLIVYITEVVLSKTMMSVTVCDGLLLRYLLGSITVEGFAEVSVTVCDVSMMTPVTSVTSRCNDVWNDYGGRGQGW